MPTYFPSTPATIGSTRTTTRRSLTPTIAAPTTCTRPYRRRRTKSRSGIPGAALAGGRLGSGCRRRGRNRRLLRALGPRALELALQPGGPVLERRGIGALAL